MERYFRTILGILLLGAMAALYGCAGENFYDTAPSGNPNTPATVSVAPQDTGDGWSVSTPDAEGMNLEATRGALEAVRDGRHTGVDSLLIARHGRLVAEGYFNGFDRGTLHDLRSAGKSFVSALAGIAIERGSFSLDDPVSQLLPRFETHSNMSDAKRAITVRHLLNMSSGLECSDWDPSSPGHEEKMYDSRDWAGFILDLPMQNPPGTVASYCTGGVVVLGEVIAQRAGTGLDAYANTYLFALLGIQQSFWRPAPDGHATAATGMRLRPRDLAKLGELYLDGGTWNGVRVVPAPWVELSRQRVTPLGSDQYGFLWWKRYFLHNGEQVDSYYASGNGGNYVFVFPSLDLVVAFTGSNYNSSLANQPYVILSDRILPAIR